jgi:putative ABC transport system permease protein
MNHYTQLAYRYLKEQKKRSILTVVGIIMSMALIFSATSMGEALKDDLIESTKLRYGNYHVVYSGLNDAQIRQLRDNAKVELTAVKQDLGYHSVRSGMTIKVTGGGAEYLDVMTLKLEKGRYPENAGELVLEQWVLDSLKGNYKLGDKLSLAMTEEPQAVGAASAGVSIREVEFTLVGTLKNKAATQNMGTGYGVTTVEYAKAVRGITEGKYDVAVRFEKGLKLQAAIKETGAALILEENQIYPNNALLTALGESGSKQDNMHLLIAQGIVIGIILVATVAVIYNAFHISVLERIRQFGILRSVGMTPRQIRRLVFREAAILAGIGIPTGILAGWGTIELLMVVFRWMDGGQFAGSLEINFHWYVPVATALIGLVAVYASAFAPAYAAGCVSPLDAVLNRNQINHDKTKKAKRRSWLSPLVGFTGRMALDNLKRNRKRYRITLFSMSIGIVLYVFFTSFMSFIQDNGNVMVTKDMAVDRFSREAMGYSSGNYQEITDIPGVKNVYRVMEDTRSLQVKQDQLTEEYRDASGPSTGEGWIGSEFQGLRQKELELLKPYLLKGGIDSAAMDADNGVLIRQGLQVGKELMNATDLQVGDLVTVGRFQKGTGFTEPVQVKVMGILEENPLSTIYGSHYSIVTTETVFTKATGKTDFARFHIELAEGAEPEAVKEQLQSVSDRIEGGRVMDYTGDDTRIVMLQISIMLYGLVAVVSLISAINIIHTISTNLILRTRELGTLRAVGMTMKQMRRMIVYESVWYGIMATIYGGTAGTLLAYWFYSSVNSVKEIPYHFPLIELLSAGAASAVICLLASGVPLKRIERMDIVKSVRAEE